MELEQKNRILKRFLQQTGVKPETEEVVEADLLQYAALGALLDYIELHNNGLFDFATLESNPHQWNEFTNLIKYSSVFTKDSPPTLSSTSTGKADFFIRYLHNNHEIANLPKDDYYTRPARIPLTIDVELNDLISRTRAKLYELTQTFPGATAFNPTDSEKVTTRIARLQEQIKAMPDSNPDKAIVQQRLNILLDINKINKLEHITIPQDNGESRSYCTLAEAAGGVTEKISLISLDSVKLQLGKLANREEGLNVANYNEEREQYKLKTEAIIKLPKHGNIKEVQHEAMALNISRMMGLDTGKSTFIAYGGHPALFIPFDDIKLLSEYSSGKTFTAGFGLTGQTYTHYSTIKPVGEGVQADRFIDDFGTAFGMFYLCSDTDALGGYCQNKGLRDSRSLFIFDQVIMDTDKFILDSRMSLQPDQFIMKHTRHGSGRNRTIIEDSSMHAKFDSIMQLKTNAEKFSQYAWNVSKKHHNRAVQIEHQLSSNSQLTNEERIRLESELEDVMTLETDALNLKEKLQARIAAIDSVLPKTTGNISPIEVRQSLILEKLIHNPVLFSDDGRPYKNPWTTRQTNNVKTINDLGNGSIQLTFSDKVPEEMVQFIKRQGTCDSLTITSPKVISISKTQLAQLSEDMLHPEHQLILSPDTDYLAGADLALIKNAYGEGNKTEILKIITNYQMIMRNGLCSQDDKIKCITETEAKLKEYIKTAADKGFGMHVLKKFYFDSQQQLQKLMNPEFRPAHLNQAFAAAMKLDRVSEFNALVLEAVDKKKLTNPQFIEFLSSCILKAQGAINHEGAQKASLQLSEDAKATLQQLQLPSVPLVVQLTESQGHKDGFAKVDPLKEVLDELVDELDEYEYILVEPIEEEKQPANTENDRILQSKKISAFS